MTKKVCSISGCNNKHMARGLCNMHYLRAMRSEKPRRRAPAGSLFCIRGHRKVMRPSGMVCIICAETNRAAWEERNPDYVPPKYGREYYAKAAQKYRDTHSEEWAAYLSEYNKQRYADDYNKYLAQLIRSRTNHAVKKWIDTGRIQQTRAPYKHGFDIDFTAIIEHLESVMPEDFYAIGYGRGPNKYQLNHIIKLNNNLDLTKKKNWEILTHPWNHEFILGRENHLLAFDPDENEELNSTTLRLMIEDDLAARKRRNKKESEQ